MNDLKEYGNLTNIILDLIRKRPSMYLRDAKISTLNTFLLGYQMAENMNSLKTDAFFGENGFTNWFMKLKGIELLNSIETPFLEECDNNEQKALELYFEYVEKYRAGKNKLNEIND